jgi:hypothetical protein
MTFARASVKRGVDRLWELNLKEQKQGELTIREDHVKFEKSAFPQSLFLARNSAFPFLHIQHALWCSVRFCVKTKRVIFSPLLSENPGGRGRERDGHQLENQLLKAPSTPQIHHIPFLDQSVLTE